MGSPDRDATSDPSGVDPKGMSDVVNDLIDDGDLVQGPVGIAALYSDAGCVQQGAQRRGRVPIGIGPAGDLA